MWQCAYAESRSGALSQLPQPDAVSSSSSPSWMDDMGTATLSFSGDTVPASPGMLLSTPPAAARSEAVPASAAPLDSKVLYPACRVVLSPKRRVPVVGRPANGSRLHSGQTRRRRSSQGLMQSWWNSSGRTRVQGGEDRGQNGTIVNENAKLRIVMGIVLRAQEASSR